MKKDPEDRLNSYEDVLAHDWLPKGEELAAIENQLDSLTPPIVPRPKGQNEEETYEYFDIRQMARLNETVLKPE